jgi:hypothetical protein
MIADALLIARPPRPSRPLPAPISAILEKLLEKPRRHLQRLATSGVT